MYEDDTIRLFGIANLLKNKKNNSNNWERDDIPDIKPQALTGKYDHNFDAPGSDFVRAHQYNFHNTNQPENTKSDVKYDDKYTKFFNYTPSKYIQLEEEEYKPIGKYNEKADEYYIDKLQGKTLDDMVISKMKENAGADDLDPRAARERFAENLAAGRLQAALEEDTRLGLSDIVNYHMYPEGQMFGNMEEEGAEEVVMAPRRGRPRKNREKEKEKIQIEPAQLSSSGTKVRSLKFSEGYRSDDEGGGGAAYVTRRSKKSSQEALEKQKQLEMQEKEEKYQAIQKKRAERQQLRTKEDEEELKEKKQNLEKLKNSKDKRTLGNVFGALKQNAETNKADKAVTKIASAVRGKQARKELQKNRDAVTTIARVFRGNQERKNLRKNVENRKEEVPGGGVSETKDENKLGGKTLSKDEAREERARQAQARLEQREEERINQLNTENRVKEYQTLIPKLNNYSSDRQLDAEDWAIYKALMKSHKHKTGNIPKASNAVNKLQEKLAEAMKSSETSVKQNKLQQVQEDQTLAGNKLNFSSDLKLVKSSSRSKTPAKKDKESEESGSLSPKLAIQGMYSHNNPKSSSKK